MTKVSYRYDSKGNLLSREVGETVEKDISREDYLNAMSIVLTGMSVDKLADEITKRVRAEKRSV